MPVVRFCIVGVRADAGSGTAQVVDEGLDEFRGVPVYVAISFPEPAPKGSGTSRPRGGDGMVVGGSATSAGECVALAASVFGAVSVGESGVEVRESAIGR